MEDTVKAASQFEKTVDPMLPAGALVDVNAVQQALTELQNTIWDAIHKLNALRGSG